MIRLEDVRKSYDGHTALDGVSLDVITGETVVLVGPSGCGKSTLLRIIVGLVSPDSGSASVFGERLSAGNLPGIRRRIGYVIQDGGLFPHLTARENASILPRHLRWPSERLSTRIDELADMVQLTADRLDLYPAELSGGQQQRVGLMRALVLDPDILLMDEPLGALDPMIRAGLQTELKEIVDRLNKTVVLVTHDLSEAATLGDRIVLMQAGSVVQTGTIDDLSDRPADSFVSEFVTAQRSLVAGLAQEGTG